MGNLLASINKQTSEEDEMECRIMSDETKMKK